MTSLSLVGGISSANNLLQIPSAVRRARPEWRFSQHSGPPAAPRCSHGNGETTIQFQKAKFQRAHSSPHVTQNSSDHVYPPVFYIIISFPSACDHSFILVCALA